MEIRALNCHDFSLSYALLTIISLLHVVSLFSEFQFKIPTISTLISASN